MGRKLYFSAPMKRPWYPSPPPTKMCLSLMWCEPTSRSALKPPPAASPGLMAAPPANSKRIDAFLDVLISSSSCRAVWGVGCVFSSFVMICATSSLGYWNRAPSALRMMTTSSFWKTIVPCTRAPVRNINVSACAHTKERQKSSIRSSCFFISAAKLQNNSHICKFYYRLCEFKVNKSAIYVRLYHFDGNCVP